jgi:DNA-binding NarL/FixJ family response regulator
MGPAERGGSQLKSHCHQKARVIVADDHVRVLESVSGLLEHDFSVVAAVTDGQHALDACHELDPDIVLLDITMPGLSGLQVARELTRSHSRARIVFLTMHPTEDYIEAALGAGAHGYVLKTRIQPDLVSALNHVVAGQRFVPSLSAMSLAAGTSGHGVFFHRNDGAFLDELSGFVAATLRHGEPFALFATEAMRGEVAQRLKTQSVDLAESAARGQYMTIDAATFLAEGMRDAWPDRDRIGESVLRLEKFRRNAGGGHRSRVTILGDLTTLWRGKPQEAAFELERVWDSLTSALPFFTVCAYADDCFADEGAASPYATVCAAHGVVGYA